MGTANLRAFTVGSRKTSRIFASLGVLLLALTAAFSAIVITPTKAVAAADDDPGTYRWVNDRTIRYHIKSDLIDLSYDFTDTNPYDANRSFVSRDTPSFCKDGFQVTITMQYPYSGTYINTVQEPPKDLNNKIDCTQKGQTITVEDVSKGSQETSPCPGSGAALQKCEDQRANGNANWVANCAGERPTSPVCNPTNNTTPPPVPPSTGSTTDTTGDDFDACSSLGDFSLRWVMCPILAAAVGFAGVMDNVIADSLDYDTTIFNRTTAGGKGFYQAWSSFRTIALALVLIAGLIMVVSQGTGMQLFDAYTVRKVLPRLLIAVIGITLSWAILGFVVGFFNDMGHWVQDIILLPFQSAATDAGSSTGANVAGFAAFISAGFVGTAATAAYFVAIGPIGILSLLGTIVLALLVAWLVLSVRNVIITVVILFAPLAIACYILPSTKKVFDFWQNAGVTMLMVFPIIMALLAAGKALSLVTENGIMKVLFLVAPYFFIPFAFKLAGGLMSTVFSMVNDKGKGGFDRMKNVRASQRKQRGEKWQDGSLFRDNGIGSVINAAGRGVGAAKHGAGISGVLPGQRGRAARSLYDNVAADNAMKRSPLLQQLQNDDPANAVLGLSGGTLAGAQNAARDIFTDEDGNYDEAGANRAVEAARAVGLNRANAVAALRTTMQNKARGIGNGNVRAVDRGVRRLARNADEYNSIAHTAAFYARDKGRADLGGTNWIKYDNNVDETNNDGTLNTGDAWTAARAQTQAAGLTGAAAERAQWQSVADSNMINGLQRTGIGAIVSGHTAQVEQTMGTLTRVLRSSQPREVRLQAAVTLKEMQGNIQAASGDTRDIINRYLYTATPDQGGLQLNPNENIADSIARQLNDPNITGQTLTTLGRTYPEYSGAPDPNLPQRQGQGGPP